MAGVPFSRAVLFPVDLRYGWDIGHKPHQQLLTTIDNHFKPLYTTFEPRCKYWSRAGNRRDPDKTQRLRNAEKPQLTYMANHAIHIANDQRDGLIENPLTSALWDYSPLHVLNYAPHWKDHDDNTSMCAFSPEPDGRRSEKRTKLKTTFKLKKSIRTCKCTKGHVHLKGYDKDRHKTRTAAAALYAKKFCNCLCEDMLEHDQHNTSTKYRQPQRHNYHSDFPVDEDDEEETTEAQALPAPATPPISLGPDAPDELDHSKEQLRNMDTTNITLTHATPILAQMESKLLKACIQDIFDNTMRHGPPGHPTGRIFAKPMSIILNAATQLLVNSVASHFAILWVCCTVYADKFPQLSNTDNTKTRVLIHGQPDGLYTI